VIFLQLVLCFSLRRRRPVPSPHGQMSKITLASVQLRVLFISEPQQWQQLNAVNLRGIFLPKNTNRAKKAGKCEQKKHKNRFGFLCCWLLAVTAFRPWSGRQQQQQQQRQRTKNVSIRQFSRNMEWELHSSLCLFIVIARRRHLPKGLFIYLAAVSGVQHSICMRIFCMRKLDEVQMIRLPSRSLFCCCCWRLRGFRFCLLFLLIDFIKRQYENVFVAAGREFNLQTTHFCVAGR